MSGTSTVQVEKEGVFIKKSSNLDEFPVPAIDLRFRVSKMGGRIRVIENFPPSFPMERIGFHPDWGGEKWTAFEDHHAVYTRDIEPNEEFRTLYGIRTTDPEDVAAFFTGEARRPTVELLNEGADLPRIREGNTREYSPGDNDTATRVYSSESSTFGSSSNENAQTDPPAHCPSCARRLTSYDDPAFCPACGTSLEW